MMLYSFGFAPISFSTLTAEDGGCFIRAAFPWYYLSVIVTAGFDGSILLLSNFQSGALALVTMGLSPSFLRRAAFGLELRGAAKGKVLICLFQRGAADALNVVVPFGERAYYQLRPSIAIPAPGGAAEAVMEMAEDIGTPDRAAEYIKDALAHRQKIMGFGHRVYRAEDPRARHMRAGVEKLSREMGQPQWYRILEAVVDAMKPYARHGVNVNVDFYAGVVYYLHGIPEDLFVPIFAIGRTPGWAVQVVEQFEHNVLIRPLTVYNGPAPRDYVPMERRG